MPDETDEHLASSNPSSSSDEDGGGGCDEEIEPPEDEEAEEEAAPEDEENVDPPDTQDADQLASDLNVDPLRMFVTVLVLKVLMACGVVRKCPQEAWIDQTTRLTNQIMEGLEGIEGSVPKIKKTQSLCRAVVKDLEKKFSGRLVLHSSILLQDPEVEPAIIESIDTHIKELFEKQRSCVRCKRVLKITVPIFIAVVAGLSIAFTFA